MDPLALWSGSKPLKAKKERNAPPPERYKHVQHPSQYSSLHFNPCTSCHSIRGMSTSTYDLKLCLIHYAVLYIFRRSRELLKLIRTKTTIATAIPNLENAHHFLRNHFIQAHSPTCATIPLPIP